MGKFTKIPSEIRNFFTEKRQSTVINDFTRLLESFSLDNRCLGGDKRENCQLTNLQVFQILVMMPFFAIEAISHYATSVMNRMFGGKKDILYSFMSQDNIDWRTVIYRITVKLISKITIRKDYRKSHLPAVLIADDSDLPKTGGCMEMIGKVFSHVHQKCILGFKVLALSWSDGRTQYMIDFSLHGEKGKVEGKEQGLTAKQRQKRYSRERDGNSCSARRTEEYFMSKGARLIEMVKRAIKAKIEFEYLLVDSWFTCTDLVDFVCKCHKRFHLLGMSKMGNTKYAAGQWGELSAKAILTKLKASKSINYCRRYRCHYAGITVMLGKREVKLFFCRMGKNEKWRILLTTNTSLDFKRAYEIYAMRWSIEVFFSDAKRLLHLAGCSARDFSSQIAHVSLVMIRYNILAYLKRLHDYETIGGLFKDIYSGVHELTVVEKIWDIILEVVSIVAELTGMDDETMLELIIQDNRRLAAFQELAKAA